MTNSDAELVKEETRHIGEKKTALTNAASERPVIVTTGVMSCMVVCIYNPETKDLAMAHLTEPSTDALEWMYKQITDKKHTGLEISIAGGGYTHSDKESSSHADMIESFFGSKGNISKVSKHLFDQQPSQAMAFDSRNGKLFFLTKDETLPVLSALYQEKSSEREQPDHICEKIAQHCYMEYDDRPLQDTQRY